MFCLLFYGFYRNADHNRRLGQEFIQTFCNIVSVGAGRLLLPGGSIKRALTTDASGVHYRDNDSTSQGEPFRQLLPRRWRKMPGETGSQGKSHHTLFEAVTPTGTRAARLILARMNPRDKLTAACTAHSPLKRRSRSRCERCVALCASIAKTNAIHHYTSRRGLSCRARRYSLISISLLLPLPRCSQG